MKKICFITGTRAEYGLLSRLMRMVADDDGCRLQIIATNMHLLPEYGETYREIEADGFTIDAKVAMRKPSDDAAGVVESMAQEMAGMNEAISRLKPDLAVILGDRYEMLVAATVCLMHRVPIAHIHGGETTEGALDDSIRHSITQMSSLHFASTEEYRRRIIAMGKRAETVWNVGAIGIDNIRRIPLMDKAELERDLGMELRQPLLLATYHPATLGSRTPREEIDDFLAALDTQPEAQVIFTLPNSDEGGDEIRDAIVDYCRSRERCSWRASLGMRRYLSLMHQATAVVGNSSSGLIEAPSAHIPTLNVGPRQSGRARGASVVDCASDRASVAAGLTRVLSAEQQRLAAVSPNPYEQPDTAAQIFNIIRL